MLTPSEIDLLRQDLTAALERREETDAITRERVAFRRYRAALAAVHRPWVPQNEDGVPTLATDRETLARVKVCEAAHAQWLETKASVEHILDELRSGQRQ